MYLFFLCFFIFISFSLIVLILLQPGKSLNNTVYSNIKNNTKFFNSKSSSFITNIIAVFSCLFLVTSIILCNINSKKMDDNFIWEDSKKNNTEKELSSNEDILKSDIPN